MSTAVNDLYVPPMPVWLREIWPSATVDETGLCRFDPSDWRPEHYGRLQPWGVGHGLHIQCGVEPDSAFLFWHQCTDWPRFDDDHEDED